MTDKRAGLFERSQEKSLHPCPRRAERVKPFCSAGGAGEASGPGQPSPGALAGIHPSRRMRPFQYAGNGITGHTRRIFAGAHAPGAWLTPSKS